MLRKLDWQLLVARGLSRRNLGRHAETLPPLPPGSRSFGPAAVAPPPPRAQTPGAALDEAAALYAALCGKARDLLEGARAVAAAAHEAQAAFSAAARKRRERGRGPTPDGREGAGEVEGEH